MSITRSTLTAFLILALAALALAVAGPTPAHAQTPGNDVIVDLELEPGNAGETWGYRRVDGDAGVFGTIDPATFTIIGGEYVIRRFERTGLRVTLAVSPCPSAWELSSVTVDGYVFMLATDSCAEDVATWTVIHVSPDVFTTSSLITLTATPVFTHNPGDIGGHRREGLRGTICAGPDMYLRGGCIPLVTFGFPLAVVAAGFAVGIRNPFILGASGVIALAGSGALMLQFSVWVVTGMVVASLGPSAIMMMLRK